MSNSEKNICSIIIGEDIKFENIAKGLDIDFQIRNDQIIGKININKDNKQIMKRNTANKLETVSLKYLSNKTFIGFTR